MPDEQTSPQENKQNPSKESEFKPKQDENALSNQTLATVEAESGSIETPSPQAPAPLPLSQAEFNSIAATSPTASTAAVSPPKKKKWPLFAAALSIFVVLLGVSGAAAYMWYQNPEKVVLDGVMNAVQSKTAMVAGDMNFSSDTFDVKIKFDTKGGAEQGSSSSVTSTLALKDGPRFSLSGDGIYAANGDVYFRVKDAKKSYESALNAAIDYFANERKKDGKTVTDAEKKQVRAQFDAIAKPVIEKVDNQWIKVAIEDIKEYDKDAGKEYECTQRVLKRLSTDKQVGKEIREAYLKNKVFKVTEGTGSRGDSVPYVIEVNEDAARLFERDIKELSIYKDMQQCSGDTKDSSTKPDASNNSSKNDDTQTRMEVWINKWNHTITGFNVSAETKKNKMSATVDAVTQFNEVITITPPTNYKGIKEITKELESAMSSARPAQPKASQSSKSLLET